MPTSPQESAAPAAPTTPQAPLWLASLVRRFLREDSTHPVVVAFARRTLHAAGYPKGPTSQAKAIAHAIRCAAKVSRSVRLSTDFFHANQMTPDAATGKMPSCPQDTDECAILLGACLLAVGLDLRLVERLYDLPSPVRRVIVAVAEEGVWTEFDLLVPEDDTSTPPAISTEVSLDVPAGTSEVP